MDRPGARAAQPFARFLLAAAVLGLGLPHAVAGQEALTVPPAFQAAPVGVRAAAPPPDIPAAKALAPLAVLAPAAEAAARDLDFIRFWNATGRIPAVNGTSRPLAASRVALDAAAAKSAPASLAGGLAVPLPDGRRAWTARVTVENAYRIRLKLEDLALPAGTEMWVRGAEEGWIGPFGDELAAERALWTPSVSGPTLTLVVALPAAAPGGAWGLRPGAVLEVFPLDAHGAPTSTDKASDFSCLQDATCFDESTLDVMSLYRTAVARLQFVRDGVSLLCSGGLVNDTDSSTVIPYFLTANHCISTQAVASTLEAFWDYRSATCDTGWPSLSSLPRSSGATLLATSVQSDFAFLRLNSIPGGRTLLGWNTATPANGAVLHRISHPQGFAQMYSQSTFLASPTDLCFTDSDGRPWGDTTKFAYSTPTIGNTVGGSSGAPVVLSGGILFGQLLGVCGIGLDEPCQAGPELRQVDGRFSATYPAIAQWLAPGSSNGSCVRNATTACLLGGRFEVKVDWARAGSSGAAQVMSFGGQRSENDESAFWWFFSPTNFELGTKVLNACGVNHRFWVFGSGLTDQGWTVRVRDTQTGATKTYNNAIGHLSSTFADTAAFPCL